MKHKNFSVAVFAFMMFLVSCESEGRYIDLESGNRVEVEKDAETGYMVNAETRKPLYIYVDTKSKDTLYGRTGDVVNGKVSLNNGKWEYDADGDFKYTDGDYQLKVEADGDYKIKEGDYKKKVDADGDYKIKDGDYKKKVDADGDIKIKDGETKIKIDGETGEKKVKND